MDERKLKTLLDRNHNIILHGAPGTGKTYLAKKIAKSLIFGDSKKELSENEQKQFEEQCGFVQFHQSYDYTDFVEGLRPVNKDKGQIGFERKDGIFKAFCKKALVQFRDNAKSYSQTKTDDVRELAKQFIENAVKSKREFETPTKGVIFCIKFDGRSGISAVKRDDTIIELNKETLYDILCNFNDFNLAMDITRKYFPNRKNNTSYQASYYNSLRIAFKEEFRNKGLKKETSNSKTSNNFVFIIDEINRGEMSKIFGELFFSIDSGYRGIKGKVRTQYANLQEKPNDFDIALGIEQNESNKDNYGHFFVPENVYIIGTMNDIDRSVDCMDFAMRRRFAFKEITAKDRVEMLNELSNNKDVAERRMNSLNEAIEKIPGLSAAYHIGPAYFLKLKEYKEYDDSFDKLWEYHIEGVVKEYLRGMDSANEKLEKLANAYKLR